MLMSQFYQWVIIVAQSVHSWMWLMIAFPSGRIHRTFQYYQRQPKGMKRPSQYEIKFTVFQHPTIPHWYILPKIAVFNLWVSTLKKHIFGLRYWNTAQQQNYSYGEENEKFSDGGGSTTWGAVLKVCSSRKVENHW